MFSTQYDKDLKLWSGHDIPPFFNPKISLAQVLLDSMTKFGSKIAQVIRYIKFLRFIFFKEILNS